MILVMILKALASAVAMGIIQNVFYWIASDLQYNLVTGLVIGVFMGLFSFFASGATYVYLTIFDNIPQDENSVRMAVVVGEALTLASAAMFWEPVVREIDEFLGFRRPARPLFNDLPANSGRPIGGPRVLRKRSGSEKQRRRR